MSGKITLDSSGGAGLANVMVSLGTYSDTTAADGTSNMQNVPAGKSGWLTPTLAGYTFNPVNISIPALAGGINRQKFVARSTPIQFLARLPLAQVTCKT